MSWTAKAPRTSSGGGEGNDPITTGNGTDVLVYLETEQSVRDVDPRVDVIVFAAFERPIGQKVLTTIDTSVVQWTGGPIVLTGTAGAQIQIFADVSILDWL